MNMKALVSIGFATHVLLGNVCMMPMAFAQEMSQQREGHMEMVMTPVFPMSPAHCEHCVYLTQEHPAPMSAGCAGHCFGQARDIIGTTISGSQSVLAHAMPPSSVPVMVASRSPVFFASHAPPGSFPPMRMVVLLQ